MNRKSGWNLDAVGGVGGLSPGSFTLASTESGLDFSQKFMWACRGPNVRKGMLYSRVGLCSYFFQTVFI